jgi:hypothetical protein
MQYPVEVMEAPNWCFISVDALAVKPEDRHGRKRIVEWVSLAYLWDDEELDSAIVQELFSGGADDLEIMTNFFWTARGDTRSHETVDLLRRPGCRHASRSAKLRPEHSDENIAMIDKLIVDGRLWQEGQRCHSACNIDPLSRGIGVQN